VCSVVAVAKAELPGLGAWGRLICVGVLVVEVAAKFVVLDPAESLERGSRANRVSRLEPPRRDKRMLRRTVGDPGLGGDSVSCHEYSFGGRDWVTVLRSPYGGGVTVARRDAPGSPSQAGPRRTGYRRIVRCTHFRKMYNGRDLVRRSASRSISSHVVGAGFARPARDRSARLRSSSFMASFSSQSSQSPSASSARLTPLACSHWPAEE
jgi:hypothetical protein